MAAPQRSATLHQQIPMLKAVEMHPQYQRPVAQAFAFLKTIDNMEIHSVDIIDTAPHYVIAVYTQSSHSHIPTVVQHMQRLAQQSLGSIRAYARGPSPSSRPRTPTFVVKRSFAAFQDLQKTICRHLDRENRGNCHACNAWLTFMTFTMPPSTFRMKMLPTMSVRKHELTKFLKAAVLLAVQATVVPTHRQQCPIGDSITEVTNSFLRKGTV